MYPTHNLHWEIKMTMKYIKNNYTTNNAILTKGVRYVLCKLCVG